MLQNLSSQRHCRNTAKLHGDGKACLRRSIHFMPSPSLIYMSIFKARPLVGSQTQSLSPLQQLQAGLPCTLQQEKVTWRSSKSSSQPVQRRMCRTTKARASAGLGWGSDEGSAKLTFEALEPCHQGRDPLWWGSCSTCGWVYQNRERHRLTNIRSPIHQNSSCSQFCVPTDLLYSWYRWQEPEVLERHCKALESLQRLYSFNHLF